MKSKTETAMSSAFARAGFDIAESLLRQHALDAMAKHHFNVERADVTFEKAIAGDAQLLRALRLKYLRAFAQTTIPGEGHELHDTLEDVAQARNPNGGDGGQLCSDNHEFAAAASPRGGTGQATRDIHTMRARPVREPSAQERAASAAVAKRISVLDTFKIGNRAIGDWSIVAANGEGHQMFFHGRVLMEATAEAKRTTANIESWMTFRDVLSEQQIQRAIQRAAGVADAA